MRTVHNIDQIMLVLQAADEATIAARMLPGALTVQQH